MFRSILSMAIVVALLASFLVDPAKTHARRCGEKDPETLLSLYKRSTTIYVATYDRTEDGGVKEETEDYVISRSLAHYSVSSTLKGEPAKSVVLEDDEYKYKGPVAEETPEETPPVAEPGTGETDGSEEIDEYEEMYGRPDVEPGDTVLLFLKKGTEGKAFEAVDYRDAIRLVKREDVGTYEARINELSVIFNSAGDRDVAIVEWLVKSIDDPVTRWDGAFELLSGFYSADWEDEQAKEEAAKSEAETEGDGTHEGEEFDIDEWTKIEMEISKDRTRYARVLSDGQKQGILNLLLGQMPRVAEEGGKIKKLSRGDQTLLELVKRWGDNRLASLLLDQLVAGAGDTYFKYQMMETISMSLSNKELAALLEQFGNELYMGDYEVVEDRIEKEGEGETVPVPETDMKAPETVGDEKAKRQTYGERRAEAMAKFITVAQTLLTTESNVEAS